jgi:hypothetical protein
MVAGGNAAVMARRRGGGGAAANKDLRDGYSELGLEQRRVQVCRCKCSGVEESRRGSKTTTCTCPGSGGRSEMGLRDRKCRGSELARWANHRSRVRRCESHSVTASGGLRGLGEADPHPGLLVDLNHVLLSTFLQARNAQPSFVYTVLFGYLQRRCIKTISTQGAT